MHRIHHSITAVLRNGDPMRRYHDGNGLLDVRDVFVSRWEWNRIDPTMVVGTREWTKVTAASNGVPVMRADR